MGNELISLIVPEVQKSADGFQLKEVLHRTEVFAEPKSVKRAEFYAAAREGMAVTQVLVVDAEDFAAAGLVVDGKKTKPSKVEYDKTIYRIIRTYQPQSTMRMELYLQEEE